MQKYKWLKWVRVFVSLAFFLLIAFLFVDFANTFSTALTGSILYFQFLPSLLKFINLLTVMATGFLIVLIINLLFGRVYCSFLCPLGTLQDIFHYSAKRFRKKKRRKYANPHNLLRYGLLIVVIIVFIFGYITPLNLLDPYSNFGRIFSNLFRPVYVGANNLISVLLEQREIYTIKPVEIKSVSWLSAGYAVFIFSLVGFLSIKHGRLYCNTICPVGTLLAAVSHFSIFKIRLDDAACTSCGICGNNCKADCIDTKEKKVDFSRCIGCLNCLTVCPGHGVKFTASTRFAKQKTTSSSSGDKRRDFMKKSVLLPIALMANAKSIWSQELKKGMIPIERKVPVTPPGSAGVEQFVNRCTACSLCVSACPTQVLQPSFLEYGLAGMMQPRMDFITSFCNFDCIVCTEVCPTGAITPLLPEVKKLTQIGKSKFVKENCVVYTDETACGACSEHCPTKAVNMVPYNKKPKLTIPEVNEDICIGCGACEYACPTTPRSIYVEGNAIHVLAQKPEEKEVEDSEKTLNDFPF